VLKYKIYLVLFLLLFFALLIVFGFFYRPGQELGPSISYPGEIDLGEREIGEIALAKFTISNNGTKDLEIDSVKTNCSCSGLEVFSKGEYLKISELILKKGETAEMALRISVRGVPPDSTAINRIFFRTNDPNHPECVINAVIPRVKSGVHLVPDILSLGTSAINRHEKRVVDVFDDSDKERSIEKIFISNPKKISAKLLPSKDVYSSGKQSASRHRRHLGQIEIEIDASSTGDLEESVHVFVTGREEFPDKVKIVGSIVKIFDIVPATLVLPRNSSNGPAHFCNGFVRNNLGQPFQLFLEKTPDGFEVEISPSKKNNDIPFRVIVNPEKVIDGPGLKKIKFLVICDGTKSYHEQIVHYFP